MAKRNKTKNNKNKNGAIGFEDKLWKAADKLRGNMDSAEYKHVVLGLIFLKYISDTFEEKRDALIEEFRLEGMDEDEIEQELEIRNYYIAENVFWIPKEARWSELQRLSKKPEIGILVDNAMQSAINQGEDLGLNDYEVAFYDAFASNESAGKELADGTLKQIAKELVQTVRKSATIEFTVKKNVQPRMQLEIRRLPRKY